MQICCPINKMRFSELVYTSSVQRFQNCSKTANFRQLIVFVDLWWLGTHLLNAVVIDLLGLTNLDWAIHLPN